MRLRPRHDAAIPMTGEDAGHPTITESGDDVCHPTTTLGNVFADIWVLSLAKAFQVAIENDVPVAEN